MYVRGYLQGSENGRVVTIDCSVAKLEIELHYFVPYGSRYIMTISYHIEIEYTMTNSYHIEIEYHYDQFVHIFIMVKFVSPVVDTWMFNN